MLENESAELRSSIGSKRRSFWGKVGQFVFRSVRFFVPLLFRVEQLLKWCGSVKDYLSDWFP